MRAGGSGNPEDLVYAMKAAELLGKANDPAEFKKFIDASIKGQQVMGKTLKDEDFLEFAKMSKTAGLQLSDRFLTTAAMSLTQEIGGMQAGTAIQQAAKTLGGGGLANNHAAVTEWKRLGFLTDDDLEFNKSGDIKGLKAGHNLKDWRLGATDPDLFMLQKLLPAMEAQGIVDPIEQNKEFERLFPGSRAANLFAHMNNQKVGLANHARMYGDAKGINALAGLLANDPSAAGGAAATTVGNLGASILGPAMAPATGALNEFTTATAKATQALDEQNKKHPLIGAISGSLMGAAGVLGGISAGAGAVSLIPGAQPVSVPVAVGAGIGAGTLAGVGMGLRVGAEAYDEATAPKTWARGRYGSNAGPSGYYRDYTFGSTGGFSKEGHMLPPSGLGYLSHYDAARVGPAVAELKGAADINLTVRVDASSVLIEAFEAARNVTASGALRPSNGPSMPEASPSR